jgi:hypothetical protein
MTHVGAQRCPTALAILPGAPCAACRGAGVRLREESAHFRGPKVQAPDLPRWRVIDMLPGDQVALQPMPLVALCVVVTPADV